MSFSKRLGLATAAGLAAATLVAGCGSSSSGQASSGTPAASTSASSGGSGGSSSGGGSLTALLSSSVDKTTAAKNAKVRMDFKASANGKDESFGGDGIADFAGKKFEISLNLPATAGVSGTIEERVIGSTFYIKMPTAQAAALGGKSWLKLDLGSLTGTDSSNGFGMFASDPTQFLATLRGVSNSVTKVGTETIRGVETTHYRAEVNVQKAIEKSGVDVGAAAKQLGNGTIPEDIYLDNNGLVRRFAVDIKSSSAGSSSAPGTSPLGGVGSGNFSLTVDYFDFGKADTSSIVAPPADQVTDFGQLLGGLASSIPTSIPTS